MLADILAETTILTLHQDEMLEVNEFLVLDHIREHDRTTRPEIARALGLAPSTVGRIVGRLLAEGAIVEDRLARTGPGRPPVHLSFNRQAGCVLAVDLGGTLCRGELEVSPDSLPSRNQILRSISAY